MQRVADARVGGPASSASQSGAAAEAMPSEPPRRNSRREMFREIVTLNTDAKPV